MARILYPLGPDGGRLQILVFREGVLSSFGHDLVLEASRWSGSAQIDMDDPKQSMGEVTVEIASLFVKEAQGGLRKLTAEDEASIAERIATTLSADQFPAIEFASSDVVAIDPVDEEWSAGNGMLAGTLSVAGRTEPLELAFSFSQQAGQLRIAGRAEIAQTRWGIKPFRGLHFGLKVRDAIVVQFDVVLPLSDAEPEGADGAAGER